MSLSLIDKVKVYMQESSDWAAIRHIVDDDYKHFWRLSIEDWVLYLYQNAAKFISAFQVIRGADPDNVSYEHCKVLIMLLKALPFTFDTGPVKEKSYSEIWKDTFKRVQTGRVLLGMGIESGIKDCGYGWFLPRIDWERLAFRHRFAHNIAFADNAMRDEYRRNWKDVKDSKDDYAKVSAARRWLELYGDARECESYIRKFLLVLIMRSYRKYVFKTIKKLIRPESYEQASSGRIGFCSESFREHFIDDWSNEIHVIDPRRGKLKKISDVLELLWGFDNQLRKGWEDAPFRVFARQAVESFRQKFGRLESERFHTLIGRYFLASHWLIPQPTSTKFFQTNHQKQANFLSIYHRKLAYSEYNHDLVEVWQASHLMCTTVNYPTQHRPAVNNRSEEEKMRYVVKQENRGIAANDSISDISELNKVTSR